MGEVEEGDWDVAEPMSAPAASAPAEPVSAPAAPVSAPVPAIAASASGVALAESAPAASGLAPDEPAAPCHRQTRRPGGKCAATSMEELRAQKGRQEWSSDYTPPGIKHSKNEDQGHFALGTLNLGDLKVARELRNQNICCSPCTILCIQEATLSTQRAVLNAASNADRHTYSGWRLQEFADPAFASELSTHQQQCVAAGSDSALAGDGGLLTIAQA